MTHAHEHITWRSESMIVTVVCSLCSQYVWGTEEGKAQHQAWHDRIATIEDGIGKNE